MNLPWNEQLSAIRKRLRLDQNAMGRRLGVSREWVSKLEKGREEPSDEIRRKTTELSQEAKLHFTELVATNVELPPDHIVSVSKGKTRPSSQQDCENYFYLLIEAALASGDPNAFPVIYNRLLKQFPISEWTDLEPDPEYPLRFPISKAKLAEMKAELKSRHANIVQNLADRPRHSET